MVLKEAICDFPLCQMHSNKKMSCDAVVVLCLLGCVCVCVSSLSVAMAAFLYQRM